jgi:beta-glucosidase-like glycosyl hydrolase
MKITVLALSILFFLIFISLSYIHKKQSGTTNDTIEMLESLSLRERIGQLCMIAAISNEERNQDVLHEWFDWQPLYRLDTASVEQLIKEHSIGGIVFFGRHTLPLEQLSLTKHFQSLSKIPLLITLDAECGLISRLDKYSVLRFPFNMTLGATHDPNLTYQLAYEIGQQLKAIGVHINFAPVVDVNNNADNPVIGMRSFGSDQKSVSELGIAYMQGLQDAGIIACAKHFPGHGDTTIDSHENLPLISHPREYLDDIELYPFKKLIEANVKSVMLAHLEVPALEKKAALPSSLSYSIATDLLQKEMGFNGLIITDALGMKSVANGYEPRLLELLALQAGADILLCPLDASKTIDYIEQAVKNGIISEEEINRKALKVLQAKEWAFQHVTDVFDIEERLQAEQAKDLKKAIYSKAITIAKPARVSSIEAPKDKTVVIKMGKDLVAFEETVRTISGLKQIKFSDYNALIEEIIEASNLIIAVQNSTFDKDTDKQALRDFIKQMKTNWKDVTVVLFCSPYRIPTVEEADTIIVAYEDDPDAQIAAAEVICGGREATGSLPISLR